MIGIAVLAFFLCVLNILFWLVFLNKFKKLFSTEDIVSRTKMQVSKLIEDVNRITSRDIDLIESKIKQLRAAAADAERKIAVARSEIERQEKLSVYSSIVNNDDKRFVSKPLKNDVEYSRLSDGLNSQNSYSLTDEGIQIAKSNYKGELFPDNGSDADAHFVSSQTGTKFMVSNDGASVASIPKIGGNVIFSDNPVKPKKTLNEQIHELSEKGYTVEMIAKDLNLTTTEVQFSLDMDS